MKKYLKNRLRNEETKNAYFKIAIFTFIALIIAIIADEMIKIKDKNSGLHPIFYFIFIIISLISANYNYKSDKLLKVKKTDITIINILIIFLLHAKIAKKEHLEIIKNSFKIYTTKQLITVIEKILNTPTDINRLTSTLAEKPIDAQLFIIYSLIDIAVLDDLYSIDDENFIEGISRKLKIPTVVYRAVKKQYLDKGMIDEKELLNKQYQIVSLYPFEAYKALGVPPTINETELKKVYRNLVKKNHPDKFFGQSEEIINQKELQFEKITEAYAKIKAYKGYK
jgi:hypothetical protein